MHALLANQTALAMDQENVLGLGLAGLIALVLLAYAVLFIGALISILTSSHSGGMKLAWVVFAFVAPFLGSLLWFLVGRGDSLRRAGATRAV
ncbi:PLD nuclease N-terminal domain-containing protein [Saccharopolyspora taberi]|uniref:Cardiolipin synthase N-terminal domain-containing protein n=1 Tax=Saccharopolyspora taberi TaxID=60895 RepID=A0ABN3VPF5_9PSEU